MQAATLKPIKNSTNLGQNHHQAGAIPRTPPKVSNHNDHIIDLSRSPRHIQNQINAIAKQHNTLTANSSHGQQHMGKHNPTLNTSQPTESRKTARISLEMTKIKPFQQNDAPNSQLPDMPDIDKDITDAVAKNRSPSQPDLSAHVASQPNRKNAKALPTSTRQALQHNNTSKKRKLSNLNTTPEDEYPPLPVPTRQLLLDYTPTIPTSNPFEALANMDTQENTIADSQPTVQMTLENKGPPPPPLILSDIPNFLGLARTLQSLCSHQLTFATSSHGNKRLKAGSINDFRKITAYLRDHDVQYHTFSLKEEKCIKLVIRGIDGSISAEDVQTALEEEHGIVTEKVAQLTSFRNTNSTSGEDGIRARKPLPLYVVYTKNKIAAKRIRNLDRLCYCKITSVDDFRPPKGPTQCYRCQGFGHTSGYCSHTPRCLKCGQQHQTAHCSKARSEPARCANCGQSHTANYRGCSAYSNAQKRMEQRANTQTSGEKHSGRPQFGTAHHRAAQGAWTNNLADKLPPPELTVNANVWNTQHDSDHNQQPESGRAELGGARGPWSGETEREAQGIETQIHHHDNPTLSATNSGYNPTATTTVTNVPSLSSDTIRRPETPSTPLDGYQDGPNARVHNPFRRQQQTDKQPWLWQQQTTAHHPTSQQPHQPVHYQALNPQLWNSWEQWANQLLMEVLYAPPQQRVHIILSKTIPLLMIQTAMPNHTHYGSTP